MKFNTTIIISKRYWSQQSSNPAVKKEDEALTEEFQSAQLIIDMRKAAKLTSID